MKKLYFIFLLLPLWGLSSAWAQSVILIGSDFTTGAVTFTVDVGAATPTWVLVEYTTDPSPTSAIMSRATFTEALCTPSSAGTLAAEGRGFLLTSSATITAKLKDVSGRFSWCAYAFDTPPNAKVNPGGGYTLRGTPPFIVNGDTLAAGVTTFGPGTCIESITDFTYNPDGIVPDPLAVTVPALIEVCAGMEIFTATAIGSTTTAMTYTWNIAGNEYTSTANTYSRALDVGESTYTVFVTNANGCASTVSNAGKVTVNPLPVIVVDGVPGSACVGNELNVQASGAFAGGSYCFNSYVDGIRNSNDCEYGEANTFTVTVPNEGTTTIKVRAMTAKGCVDSVFVHVPDMSSLDCINSAGIISSNSVTAILGRPPLKTANKPMSISEAVTASPTYEWRRTGTSSARLANSNTHTYNIASDSAAIYTAGIYYYNRWAFDGTPDNSVGLRAEGSYTLKVVAPPNSPSGTTTWLDDNNQIIWSGAVQTYVSGLDYTNRGAEYGYYYANNALKVSSYIDKLCPSPWSPPATAYGSAIPISWFGTPGWEPQGRWLSGAWDAGSGVYCWVSEWSANNNCYFVELKETQTRIGNLATQYRCQVRCVASYIY
jgi:hypothetical protein